LTTYLYKKNQQVILLVFLCQKTAMIRKLLKYIQYLFTASSPHDVHSPFVFEFISVIMRHKHQFYPWSRIEQIRLKLLSNTEYIGVVDHGAFGKGESYSKTIKAIASKAAIPKKFGELLFQSCLMLKATNILELGTSFGIGTAYLASANKQSKVTTLEGCPTILSIASKNFNSLGLNNITPVSGNFDTTLPKVLSSLYNLDVVYIDGNHTYEATVRYFDWILPKLNKEALVIIDDIYWSKGMEKAWNTLLLEPKATVSIDLYRMGLLFFKPGQQKQHFKLRF
jgi:predicted O-methyltransferase YrrM